MRDGMWLLLALGLLAGLTGLFGPVAVLEAARESSASARTPDPAWGRELYTHYCAMCHGSAGDGNGFNAPRLSVKPANHTDAVFMGERSDEKLFDTINLGGAEVAKSTLMPPWGAALADDNKIRALVLHLRALAAGTR